MLRLPLSSIFRSIRDQHPTSAARFYPAVFTSSPLLRHLSSCPCAGAPASQFSRTASSTQFRRTSSPLFVWRVLPPRRAQSQWPQRKVSKNELYTYRRFDSHGSGVRGRFNYIWVNYRYVIVGGGVVVTGFYVWNLEQVPVR